VICSDAIDQEAPPSVVPSRTRPGGWEKLGSCPPPANPVREFRNWTEYKGAGLHDPGSMLQSEPASVLSQTAPSHVLVALVTEPVAKMVESDVALTPPVEVPPGRWAGVQLAPPSRLTTRGCGMDPVNEGAVLAKARVEDTQSTAAQPQPP